jgi:hypothetical protein
MSQLLATALLLTLGAGSAGLWTVTSAAPLPQPLVSQLPEAELTQAHQASAALMGQLNLADEEATGAIAAEICLDLPDWQRPSEGVQFKQLEAMPHYGPALEEAPLAELSKAWWSHEIFSFTTYGLSARTDPLYLSGLWSAMDEIWACYSGDQGEQINQGERAELWLLHHRLAGLEWQGGEYRVIVEPVETGLQLVQFPRRERGEQLPLTVVTTAGQSLAVMSGDW